MRVVAGAVACILFTFWALLLFCAPNDASVKLPLPVPEVVPAVPDDADDMDRLLMTAESEVELNRREREAPTRPDKVWISCCGWFVARNVVLLTMRRVPAI